MVHPVAGGYTPELSKCSLIHDIDATMEGYISAQFSAPKHTFEGL